MMVAIVAGRTVEALCHPTVRVVSALQDSQNNGVFVQVCRGTVRRYVFQKSVVCGAGFDPKPRTQKPEITEEEQDPVIDLDDSEIEARLLKRRLRKKKNENKTGAAFTADVDAIPESVNLEAETAAIYTLTSLFGLILLNGIIIAASGFLPEAVDHFAEQFLYPSFSPLVIVFLVCSTLYGLWKTQQGKKE